MKIDGVSRRGGKVVLHGDSYSDALPARQKLEAETATTFIHPYDDPDVIAGQGTIGMEILRQPTDPRRVCRHRRRRPAGVAAYIKRLKPKSKSLACRRWILTPCTARLPPAIGGAG